MTYIAGIDEAGRGPVIGPMVMALALIEKEKEDFLLEIGVKDSKLLTPEKRNYLFDIIKKECRYKIIILSPQQIDSALNDPSLNLNKLEAITAAKLINSLNLKSSKLIIDSPSNNSVAYKQYLIQFIEPELIKKTELIVENKADLNYLIVGAASILAKVTRDREIEKLKKKHGIDFGSGYPSDPKTIRFLKENYNNEKLSEIFRKSWQSYKRLADGKNQRKLFC